MVNKGLKIEVRRGCKYVFLEDVGGEVAAAAAGSREVRSTAVCFTILVCARI